MAPAIPFIIEGGSALASYFASKKAQQNALQMTPQEQAANAAQTAAQTSMQNAATGALNTAMPYIQQSGNYFQTLLHGDRASMAQATQGPRMALTDQLSGAQRGLQQSGMRGAQLQQAQEQLRQQAYGNIASLTSGVQQNAASNLSSMGNALNQTATGMLTGAGNVANSMYNQAAAKEAYANQQGQQAGQLWGSLLYDVGTGVYNGFRGTNNSAGGGGTTPIQGSGASSILYPTGGFGGKPGFSGWAPPPTSNSQWAPGFNGPGFS